MNFESHVPAAPGVRFGFGRREEGSARTASAGMGINGDGIDARMQVRAAEEHAYITTHAALVFRDQRACVGVKQQVAESPPVQTILRKCTGLKREQSIQIALASGAYMYLDGFPGKLLGHRDIVSVMPLL
ncbi:MAG: hypothetical protein L0I62_08850 [Gammaproteobacteria bacterium]|nr:hypothetical protein [Gammaproteobacteria bacterium]